MNRPLGSPGPAIRPGRITTDDAAPARTISSQATFMPPYASGLDVQSSSVGIASSSGTVAGVPPSAALSAYTLPVDTNTQCASGTAATAARTCDGVRETSTTASKPVSSAGHSPLSRSSGTCSAPAGTGPDRPRQAQTTSWPRRTAPAATASDRKTVPPSTRIRMPASQAVREARGEARSLPAEASAARTPQLRGGVSSPSSHASKNAVSSSPVSCSIQSRYSSRVALPSALTDGHFFTIAQNSLSPTF